MKRIHLPYVKFKGWLKSNELTYSDLAQLLGTSTATISSKINGQSDFYLSEVQVIKNKYDLQYDIFFTNCVA